MAAIELGDAQDRWFATGDRIATIPTVRVLSLRWSRRSPMTATAGLLRSPTLIVQRRHLPTTSAEQMLTNVDEIGKTTSKVYDCLGRQTSTTNRVSATCQLAYDALSRVIKQTDALGNIIDVQYNNRGWVSKTIYPDRRVNP